MQRIYTASLKQVIHWVQINFPLSACEKDSEKEEEKKH